MKEINHCQIPLISRIKVNGYAYRGSNSIFFVSVFVRDLLLKERICSSRSKLFPVRVDLMSSATSSGEANKNSSNLIITLFF